MKHTVQSYGYYKCPTFDTLAEARTCLKEIVAENLKAARRTSKQARKHKMGKDSYRITLGSDLNSSLWSATFISSH